MIAGLSEHGVPRAVALVSASHDAPGPAALGRDT